MKVLAGLFAIALLFGPATFGTRADAAAGPNAAKDQLYTPARGVPETHGRVMLACRHFIMDSQCSSECWRRYANNFGEGSKCQKQCMHCAE